MPSSESERLLERTIAAMEQQKHAVKVYFDNGSNMDGLHCCANALLGLRTSGLSPKAYYEIHIKAMEVLNMVDVYLTDEFRQGKSIPHLYEMVQYVSSVLPRLYLLITVGVVYMRVGELPVREILRDLVEMCRGVQHPLRGLFLRNFLLTSIPANLLPDTLPPEIVAEEAGVNGSSTQVDVVQGKEISATSAKTGQCDSSADVLDSVNFILLNFAEMNKLWVRMQHQGHTRERERREQERRDLRVLVGANLHRLSQLSSITPHLYRQHILPRILTQLIECRDVIAQEYLMDAIVQTFPDEFHAVTLPQFLQACEHLQPAVKLKPIISSLVERLLRYVSEEENGNGEALFQSLSVELGQLVHRRGELYSTTSPVTASDARIGLPPEDVPGLFAPLLSMAIALPESIRTNQVNAVLLSAATALETLSSSSTVRIQGGSILSRELLGLLYLPLYGPGFPLRLVSSTECATLSIFSSGVPNPISVGDQEKNAGPLGCLSTLLSLSGLRKLCGLLDISARRRFASLFISRAVERSSTDPASQQITTEEDLDALCEVIGVLIDRQEIESSMVNANSDDTVEELSLLAASIHLIGKSSDEAMEEKLALLTKMRKRLATGGAMVIKATFPTLVFEVTQLISRCTTEEFSERLIAFCHQSNTKLIANNAADVALRLFLHCTLVITHSESALSAERTSLFAYEFFSQAFTLFEQGQQLGDARCQFAAFEALVSTLVHASPRCHLLDNTEAVLRTQVSRAATTLLLLRADQSRAVAISGQLFLPYPSSEVKEGTLIDSEGVFGCLDKSRSLADMCMDIDTRTQLYVDLLNYHLIYHHQGVGPLESMQSRMNSLLTEMEKLSSQLEFVPDSLAAYLKATRAKALEIINSS